MKISRRNQLRSIVVLVAAAVLLELTTAVQFYAVRTGLTRQLTEMARRDFSATNSISQTKQTVENVIAEAMPEVERFARKNDVDSLHTLIRQIVSNQPLIVGVDFCHVVGDDGNRKGVFIYKNDKDEMSFQQIDFDFTERSWYSEGIRSDGFWSEPYKSNYKIIWMCTFSRVVRDEQGKPLAVIGADVPLSEISALASQLYKNQQRWILPVILFHIIGLAVLAFIIKRSVDSMSRLQEVGAEKKRIEGELSIARNIQLAMLPKKSPSFPKRKDVDLYGSLTPAREVGGDLYDFLIRDEKLFFCVGDVSGKGVPAALVMAVAISMFRMLCQRESQPDRIVTALNDAMAADNEYNIFVTLFVGVLDLPTGRLRYCNAGHPAPFLNNQPLDIIPNMPVGTFSDFKYKGQETVIKPGSFLFLYTDGLNEAEAASNLQFGKDRIAKICSRTIFLDSEDYTPNRLIEEMTGAVQAFVAGTEQNDDLTMLAIKYTKEVKDLRLKADISLKCDLNEVPRLTDFVDSVCVALNISSFETMQVNLAIEEAVVNVMNYAYPADSKGMVLVEAMANEERLKFVITDNGQPFDPTTRYEVDTSQPIEERPIGGLGIHLIRRYMDSINYERVDGKNILTLRKILKKENQ